MKTPIQNRIDFVYIFDVKDGNPNGDPDAGNLPRIDPETSMGLVTDVCLKRKVRNYVQIARGDQKGYDIFIREKAILNNEIDRAYDTEEVARAADKTDKAREVMCRRFFDVRTFGAVMTTGKNAGQVKGPVQFTFARSVDPILTSEHTVTRMAVTTEEESRKQGGDNRTMGRKATVPYGLYVAYGFISPSVADKTGFSADDEALLMEALQRMFDHDRSAARGLMSPRRLIVFRHSSRLGDAAAHTLFDAVRIARAADGPARDFSDYTVTVDRDMIPSSIAVEEKI